ncbi:hypothetical protein DN820_10100 [Stutzerimonas nosocomialis]|uniref:Uncharacterized protein n=2 Tax=Stutzerimonas nosocomialis TaxID=1056496 RepID=A0A5R9QF09_9GAMM|nr:hypothetical protein DN820_10100 [Stutzerimonas nosocomialis]
MLRNITPRTQKDLFMTRRLSQLAPHVKKALVVTSGIAAAITFYWQFHPWLTAKTNNPAFYGRWLSEYEYPNGPGRVNIRGVMEYLENGTFRYSGLMTVKLPDVKGQIIYRISSAGEWDGNDERVIIKLSDSKSALEMVETDKIKVSGAQYTKLMGEPAKFAEIPQGTPEHFQVHWIEHNRITLSVSDLDGNPVTFDMLRTPKRIL